MVRDRAMAGARLGAELGRWAPPLRRASRAADRPDRGRLRQRSIRRAVSGEIDRRRHRDGGAHRRAPRRARPETSAACCRRANSRWRRSPCAVSDAGNAASARAEIGRCARRGTGSRHSGRDGPGAAQIEPQHGIAERAADAARCGACRSWPRSPLRPWMSTASGRAGAPGAGRFSAAASRSPLPSASGSTRRSGVQASSGARRRR